MLGWFDSPKFQPNQRGNLAGFGTNDESVGVH
jgi:hypothetical protein